jgi:hypothetical protein
MISRRAERRVYGDALLRVVIDAWRDWLRARLVAAAETEWFECSRYFAAWRHWAFSQPGRFEIVD